MAAGHWESPQAETVRFVGQKVAMDRWGALEGTSGRSDPRRGDDQQARR